MNWRSILATSIVTGLVTVSTGMLLFWWQDKSPELTYYSVRSLPFEDASDRVFIQQVEVKNTGDAITEDVLLVIDFNNGEIEKFNVLIEQSIAHTSKRDGKRLSLSIPTLNQGEEASVTILVQSSTSHIVSPTVSVRGKGVTGKPAGQKTDTKKYSLAVALISVYMGMFVFVMLSKRGRNNFRNNFRMVFRLLSQGKIGDLSSSQRFVCAAALCKYGVPELAERYLDNPVVRRFWAEADYWGAKASELNQEQRKRLVLSLSELASADNVAEQSQGILQFNIAKIKEVDGHDYSGNLEIAHKLGGAEVESRLAAVPHLK